MSQVISFIRQRRLLSVLLLCHLPFAVVYFRSLWQQTHYQFFPFALGAFAWFFLTRRNPEPERWGWLNKSLISLDIVCLGAALLLNSPWLGMVGLIACLAAWTNANRDIGYDRRLTYLTLLPLLTIRLPLQYDLQVINWLQRITTLVASKTLHRVGLLHYREGNVLQFPGKSFMVEEACSGVQSLFTILFIAALVVCLKRRSIVHSLILLTSGLLFAGIMNSLRVITIAVAWDQYATDLSHGFRHDLIGYIALSIAAALVMSADAFLAFLMDPVPDIRRPGPVGLFLNPVIRLWNNVMTVMPSNRSMTSARSTNNAGKLAGADSDAAERRSYPGRREFFRPSNMFHFCFGWAECWLFSRRSANFWGGFPFVLVTSGGVLLMWWLRHASAEPLIANYESAYNAAVKAEDTVLQETCLRALSELRHSEPQYRFRLAQFMIQAGRLNEGFAEILKLAPANGLGHVEARMWLVKQATQPKPMKPLTLDEIEVQLKAVLNQSAKHVEAHQMLAQLYAQRKEWKLAELHLTEAASVLPEQNVALARLKKQLNRDTNEVAAIAQKAIDVLAVKLESDRRHAPTRVAMADAYMTAGQETQAREILVSGLQQSDDPLLRKALSELDIVLVDRRLAESPLNRDACGPVVLEALRRDPSCLPAVQALVRLHLLGLEISPTSIEKTVSHWQAVISDDSENLSARILLSQLHLISGDHAQSAEVIRPAVAERPELRLTLADRLLRSGENSESTQLLETLIEEAQATLKKTPDDVGSLSQLAEAQLTLGRAEDVRALLAKKDAELGQSRIPDDAALAAIYGRACLKNFDQLTGYVPEPVPSQKMNHGSDGLDSTAEAALVLELLDDAFACKSTSHQAIDRLSRLSLSDHPAATGAEDMLRQLRLEGTYGAQVLNLLGMHALMMNRFDKARPYLEQANIQTRGRDPMILNNLATALVRSGESKERALQLANETLTFIPDHPDALSTRGEVYVALERWPEAIADLTQSLKFRQKSAELHRLLEKAYTGLADPSMAEEHRERAKELEAQTKHDG